MLLAAIIPTKTGVLTSCRAISDAPFLIFLACLPKQRFERDGRELRFLGMLVEANSAQQLIELPIEAIDCLLARLQQNLLGFGSDVDAEKFVGALDNLQRLSKIVAGHGEEHGLKVGGALWICAACHSQGYWLLGRAWCSATSFTIASGLFVSVMMPSLPLRDLVGCLGCWDESCAASVTRWFRTDDPRWIKCEKSLQALWEADEAAALGLINTEPTTLAGAAALMRYVADLEAKGHSWPSGLQDDDAEPTKLGKDWEVYLHRNIAQLLSAAA